MSYAQKFTMTGIHKIVAAEQAVGFMACIFKITLEAGVMKRFAVLEGQDDFQFVTLKRSERRCLVKMIANGNGGKTHLNLAPDEALVMTDVVVSNDPNIEASNMGFGRDYGGADFFDFSTGDEIYAGLDAITLQDFNDMLQKINSAVFP
jgi:hypothetical protein